MAYIAYFCKSLKVSIPLDLEETEKPASRVFQKFHQYVCIFLNLQGSGRYSCTRLHFANMAFVEIQAQLLPLLQQTYNLLFGTICYL